MDTQISTASSSPRDQSRSRSVEPLDPDIQGGHHSQLEAIKKERGWEAIKKEQLEDPRDMDSEHELLPHRVPPLRHTPFSHTLFDSNVSSKVLDTASSPTETQSSATTSPFPFPYQHPVPESTLLMSSSMETQINSSMELLTLYPRTEAVPAPPAPETPPTFRLTQIEGLVSVSSNVEDIDPTKYLRLKSAKFVAPDTLQLQLEIITKH